MARATHTKTEGEEVEPVPTKADGTAVESAVEPAEPAKPEQGPVKAEAVTGRPNDIPLQKPALANSTFVDRAKARGTNKKVDPDDAARK